MKRTTVRADEEDLVILKEAARRQGVPEAELLRESIHLVAMANRTWDRPFFTHSYTADGEPVHTGEVLEQVWSEKADGPCRRRECCPRGRVPDRRMLTLDRRDFRAIQPLTEHRAFRLLPGDA